MFSNFQSLCLSVCWLRGSFMSFMNLIYVMVLYCGVLILILQFVGRVIGDDVVAHCVLVVVAFV